MSVPREGEMVPIRNRWLRQVSEPVPAETANSRNLAQKQSPSEALREFSTGVRSASRNQLSSPGVICIPTSVALRDQELSGVEFSSVALRTGGLELRTGVSSTACCESVMRTPVLRIPVLRIPVFAFPTTSPKSMLAGVFENMKRAARSKKSQRIGERLATQAQSAYQRPRSSAPGVASH